MLSLRYPRAAHGNHLLEAQEGQAMRHEDSLAQLPSEIIHISLQQPSPPVPAALSGTSIKAKVLNALATVLKGQSTASCGSAQGCQDTPPDTAGVFIPLETLQASIQRSEPAASLQNQAHTLSGHTDHVGLVRLGHAAYSGLGISLQIFLSGLASAPLARISLSCKSLEGYTAVG
jgi:hypothetical protein